MQTRSLLLAVLVVGLVICGAQIATAQTYQYQWSLPGYMSDYMLPINTTQPGWETMSGGSKMTTNDNRSFPGFSSDYYKPMDTSQPGWLTMEGGSQEQVDTVGIPATYPSEYVRPLDTTKPGWEHMQKHG